MTTRTKILFKQKTTTGAPIAANMTVGEPIINTVDGTISILKSDGVTVVTFVGDNSGSNNTTRTVL